MSTFEGFSPLQDAIIEGLRRGEAVVDIARRLNTTPAYVYNTRSEAKGMGFTITPSQDTNPQQPVNGQPEHSQPPVKTDPGLVSSTDVTQQVASTQTFNPERYQGEKFDYVESYLYINRMAELRQQVPQAQQAPPKSFSTFMDEFDMRQTRFWNGLMRLLPYVQSLKLSYQYRKYLERKLGLS